MQFASYTQGSSAQVAWAAGRQFGSPLIGCSTLSPEWCVSAEHVAVSDEVCDEKLLTMGRVSMEHLLPLLGRCLLVVLTSRPDDVVKGAD
jgi:hypothetical protein